MPDRVLFLELALPWLPTTEHRFMRILHFVPHFSRLTETFIYGLVRALQKELDWVGVMTFERLNADVRPFAPVELHPLATRRCFRRVGHLMPVLIPAVNRLPNMRLKSPHQELVSYLEAIRPDVVHAHFGSGGLAVADSCFAARVPLVVSFRGFDASRYVSRRRWRMAYRWMFRRTAAVVLVSEEMRSRIGALVPDGVLVRTIHAGKEVGLYAPVEPVSPVKRFLSVGRLVEKKGFDDTIRAIGHARKSGTDVSLEIVGEGPMRRTLQSLAKEEGVEQFIRFLDELPHEQLIDKMREADGFILASRTGVDGDMEGIPNVLKEAQLVGLPVVSTKHGGIPYVVQDGNHRWLVREGDWQALGRRIVELNHMDIAELKNVTRRGREHVEAEFSLEKEVAEHLKLYEEVTGAGFSAGLP